MQKGSGVLISIGIFAVIAVAIGFKCFKSVPAGHYAVATLFGEVISEPYKEGLHLPVNPLYQWSIYDCKEKTHMETANVPSQDQQQTRIDVSVQFRLIGESTPKILKETGSFADAVNVHLVPNLRSILREQGKTVEKAEDFFQDKTQERLQVAMQEKLDTILRPKGIMISAVLIRDVTLPPFITKAIEEKKQREQEVMKQAAELERYRTEQQQKIAMAEAEKKAALEEAEKKQILADAEAYHIKKINEAIAENPAYLKLKALESLQAIAKDPASKIYFLNGDSPDPLPLMHIGDQVK